MLDSFVSGVTADGCRHPLFVGTIGEARAFMESARAAGGVVGQVRYRQLRLSEGIVPAQVASFDDPAAAAPERPGEPAAPPAPPAASGSRRRARAPGRAAVEENGI